MSVTSDLSEEGFAALVDRLAASAATRDELTTLLREDHVVYLERSAAAIVRMRGWLLMAIGRVGVGDDALMYVLEELDTGTDSYLVAAAARALRSVATPAAVFAPFVVRAIEHVRYRDEFVSFERYGEYAVAEGTSPVRELLATLTWLGPHAEAVLPDIEALRGGPGKLPRKLQAEVDRAIQTIRGGGSGSASNTGCCELPSSFKTMWSWTRGLRRSSRSIDDLVLEDQQGETITFAEYFHRRPTIVAFFYTRCDNPLKCSLTVTKLARVQQLLDERGLADRIQTAAITYDPAYDGPDRLRSYGRNRGMRIDAGNRLFRTTTDFDALRRHFGLGVNFIESLVNRHRIEIYITDAAGQIAGSFERIHWDEQTVVDRAVDVLEEDAREVDRDRTDGAIAVAISGRRVGQLHRQSAVLGTLASLGAALFPKCPVCWAAYMSMFGIAGIERIPYTPWINVLLVAVVLTNVTIIWHQGRAMGRTAPFWLVATGAGAIVASRLNPDWEGFAGLGIALTLAGSLLSVFRLRHLKTSIAAS